jgi:hypothetical protein
MRLPHKFDGQNKEALAEAKAVLDPSREGDYLVGDIQLQAIRITVADPTKSGGVHCLVGK